MVVGVRPQYIKAAALQSMLSGEGYKLRVLDVAQHYDAPLRGDLLGELGLDVEMICDVSRESRGGQADFGNCLGDLEQFLARSQNGDIAAVISSGDASPALMAALAAKRAGLPLIRLEGGVRRDPAELEHWTNVVADRLANVIFSPTADAASICQKEAPEARTFLVGDLYSSWLRQRAEEASARWSHHGTPFSLVTLHRPQNCSPDQVARLQAALLDSGGATKWISHPRTTGLVRAVPGRLEVLPPQGYLATLGLLISSQLLVTDSGGLVREAVQLGKRVAVCHLNGMWPELVKARGARIVDIGAVDLGSQLSEIRSAEIDAAAARVFEVPGGETLFLDQLRSLAIKDAV